MIQVEINGTDAYNQGAVAIGLHSRDFSSRVSTANLSSLSPPAHLAKDRAGGFFFSTLEESEDDWSVLPRRKLASNTKRSNE